MAEVLDVSAATGFGTDFFAVGFPAVLPLAPGAFAAAAFSLAAFPEVPAFFFVADFDVVAGLRWTLGSFV